MSRKYKFSDPDGTYFVSFAVVNWIDVFTRRIYFDCMVESLKHCSESKGLIIHGWCIMSNHVHLIVSTKPSILPQDVIRDVKKFTSKRIVELIRTNPRESRKQWMLNQFEFAGNWNSNNIYHQFWQQNNHPIQLQSPIAVRNTLEYIHQNPVVSGFVDEPAYYIYSSARDYSGDTGLIELEMV